MTTQRERLAEARALLADTDFLLDCVPELNAPNRFIGLPELQERIRAWLSVNDKERHDESHQSD